MKDISKIRHVVALFFQVPESEVTESFVFPPHRLQSSLGRSTFHSAIKRIAQVDLPGALTARSFGELIGGQPAAPSAAPAPPAAAGPGSPTPAPLAAQPFRLQTGVDIAALDELPAAGTPLLDAFMKEHFSSAELAYAKQRPDPRLTLLGLWAAKEAVLKCGWSGKITARDVEIFHDPQGQPRVVLPPTLARPGQHSVSISHAGAFAIAVSVRAELGVT
jgi:phosphopantetheine--protein transferase-like protein